MLIERRRPETIVRPEAVKLSLDGTKAAYVFDKWIKARALAQLEEILKGA